MKVRIILLLLVLFPVFQRVDAGKKEADEREKVYNLLKLGDLGLSYEAFKLALQGLDKLNEEGKLINSSILTIIDFSQSSKNKRMYVIDLYKKMLLFNTYVAHGRNTGNEYATNFSNKEGSFMSSLGFYITQNIATGSRVGLSLILQGIEKGINDKAQQREIIMHGADYATEDFIRKYGRLGRSYGCPSLPPDQIKPVAEAIKGGTCLFIYKHDDNYIHHSSLLN
jgi:hypothetical protein